MRRSPGRRVVLGLAVALLVLTGCGPKAPTTSQSSVDVDTPALASAKQAAGIETCTPGTAHAQLPDLTLPCLGGGPSVDLDTLKGPLIINLWASNCGPCRTELPILRDFATKYGDRVPVLGIDWVDTLPGAAIDLLKTSGVTYPQLADPGGALLDQQSLTLAQASPQTLFLKADGTLGAKHPQAFTSLEQLKQLAEQQFGITL